MDSRQKLFQWLSSMRPTAIQIKHHLYAVSEGMVREADERIEREYGNVLQSEDKEALYKNLIRVISTIDSYIDQYKGEAPKAFVEHLSEIEVIEAVKQMERWRHEFYPMLTSKQ